jgi:hypothetical protein
MKKVNKGVYEREGDFKGKVAMKGEVEENETCLEFLIFHFGTACHPQDTKHAKIKNVG